MKPHWLLRLSQLYRKGKVRGGAMLSVMGIQVCSVWTWSPRACAFAGTLESVTIFTWISLGENQNPGPVSGVLQGLSGQGSRGKVLFPVGTHSTCQRVVSRAVSLGFLKVTPGNLAWPCCGLGRRPRLPQGFCRTRVNFCPGWPQKQLHQEACCPP